VRTCASCDRILFPNYNSLEYFCRLGMNEAYQQLVDVKLNQ
jgi:hypothetical protein